MGSLPELTECARPTRAARTSSDPQRHRTLVMPLPISTISKRDWLWRKGKTPQRAAAAAPNVAACGGGAANTGAARRRESGASSVGAASVRRLLARAPPRLPPALVRRFTLLCVSSGLCAAALLPFTAFAGAEGGALPLALMHAAAALVAPLAPLLLRRVGPRVLVSAAHVAVCVLLAAHVGRMPLGALLALYAACGATLSPMTLALASAAVALAQAAGEEARRRVTLRRALRALRAAQDVALVAGALLLAAALLLWPEPAPALIAFASLANDTGPTLGPSDEYFEEEYEERACGAAGCPLLGGGDGVGGGGVRVSAEGRRALVAAWGALAAAAAVIAAAGGAPVPPPAPAGSARQVLRDPRTLLGAPMGLFIGLQQGFIYTSYIKWYGVCVGGWWGGWRALVCLGALQTVAAGTLSMAAAGGGGWRGRRAALAAGGGAAHAALLLALLRWRAAHTDLALPALAAAAWGACGALWDVLQSSVCVGGCVWCGPWSWTVCARHAGLAAACAARALVCARTQLAALAVALAVALLTHAALEFRHARGGAGHRARS